MSGYLSMSCAGLFSVPSHCCPAVTVSLCCSSCSIRREKGRERELIREREGAWKKRGREPGKRREQLSQLRIIQSAI